jgi:hypothetical protein
VTQLPLGLTLADRVRAWAEQHDGARFVELCEAMGVGAPEVEGAPPWPGATEVDAAAREVGALRWVAGDGVRGRFDVCRPTGGEEQGR